MSSNDLAIQAKNLSKCYNIYNKPADRLKQSIVPKVLGAIGKPPRTYYREFWALRSLSLDIKKGETVGIIGRNGSGKSTLLQIITGILTPTTGTIAANGRITALLELGSGFNPEFTGRENVFMNGAILGLSQDEVEARFDAIAQFADIGEFIEQPVKFYSSGMTVRLAFAVQAMVDPDILIVDEALAVGDERFQRKCFNRLSELKKNGTSILFVSHSMQQIIESCDRALLLEQGERLLMANPLTAVRAYQRILYATQAEQSSLMQEIKEHDDDNTLLNTHFQKEDKATPLIISPDIPEKDFSRDELGENILDKDFYDPTMISESISFYPVNGAKINSLKIYNLDGKEVNNLLARHEYYFDIRGIFLEAREFVHISFGLRIISGVGVSAIYYPGYTQYINAQAGQEFHLRHKLRMNLNPNTYFANVGIFSTTEPTCMHRITDAIMFRVLQKKGNRVFGYVDLTEGMADFEMIG
jgi:lipopolysaccharide transport system ATP-binding protein